MSHDHVLDQAEQRGTAAAAAEARRLEAIVESVREAVGRALYETAKQRLPAVEEAIRREYLPFVARVSGIAQKAGVVIPNPLREWLTEMGNAADRIPRQIKQGIAEYEGLNGEALLWKDRTPDRDRCPQTIADIQTWLRAHTHESSLRQLKGQAERYITDSGWPQRGAASTLTTGAPRPATEAEIRVESEFRV